MNKIEKTERFLKETFEKSEYFASRPVELSYRLEHSFRVANIAAEIARAEGMDAEAAAVAGLLHDISYAAGAGEGENRYDHGRVSAAMSRDFVLGLGFDEKTAMDILYGIAIHVDDRADFDWRRSMLAVTVGDADNIDRFDAYRIYEILQSAKFDALTLEEKRERAEKTLARLERFKDADSLGFGSESAKKLWLEKIEFQTDFYLRLKQQLENSDKIK